MGSVEIVEISTLIKRRYSTVSSPVELRQVDNDEDVGKTKTGRGGDRKVRRREMEMNFLDRAGEA
jgi:hypothetical protein